MHQVIAAELAGSGVRTTLISPGAVDTAAWDAVDPDSRPGFTKRKDMLQGSDVAAAVLFAVTRPPRVEVTEMRLMPGR
jgi:NADP-dependent 3-hydroxy acid dehydrogenase YdfG